MNLENTTAKRLYPDAPGWFKEQLEGEFGKEFFQESEWGKIKTFDDACRACGTTEKEFNKRFKKLGLEPDTIGYEKAKIVIKAINGGWTPDWGNNDQTKYYPWFKVLPSGSGFDLSNTYYSYDYTNTFVGSRLCFKSSEQAIYTANQFPDIYQQFLL